MSSDQRPNSGPQGWSEDGDSITSIPNVPGYHLSKRPRHNSIAAGECQPSSRSSEPTSFFFRNPTPAALQRSDQACDKCRERKTKVGFASFSQLLASTDSCYHCFSAPVITLPANGVFLAVSFVITPRRSTRRPKPPEAALVLIPPLLPPIKHLACRFPLHVNLSLQPRRLYPPDLALALNQVNCHFLVFMKLVKPLLHRPPPTTPPSTPSHHCRTCRYHLQLTAKRPRGHQSLTLNKICKLLRWMLPWPRG